MKSAAVLCSVAALALSGALSLPAEAADIITAPPLKAPPLTYIPAPFFWTGYYLGLTGGAGWGSVQFVDPFSATATTGSSKGWTVGGVTGINYQINWFVIGGEFDFTGTWLNSSTLDNFNNTTLQNDVFWTSTLTGRVGVAFDHVLVFAKGGGAFGYDRDKVFPLTGGVGEGSTIRTGWTVGGGVEYAITEHWIGRVEYDYLQFGRRGISFASSTPLINGVTGSVGYNINELRGAISYKF